MSHLSTPRPGWQITLPAILAITFALAVTGCDMLGDTSGEKRSVSQDAGRTSLATTTADACVDGQQPSGALYQICTSDGGPSGTLAVYSHGVVFPQLPLTIPATEAGIDVRAFLLERGFDFAATSFHVNGLIRPELGVRDLHNLVVQYTRLHGPPRRVLLFSVSNGSLMGTMALEKHPNLFDGALVSCIPTGDFRMQVNYLTEFLVLFQHYFPGVIPGGPGGIPESYIQSLATAAVGAGVGVDQYLGAVLSGILTAPANLSRTIEILNVAATTPDIGAAFASVPEGLHTLIRGLIYNVLATNNAVEVLGGTFFENTNRMYAGSSDDAALNTTIARYAGDVGAVAQIRVHYETKGASRLRSSRCTRFATPRSPTGRPVCMPRNWEPTKTCSR